MYVPPVEKDPLPLKCVVSPDNLGLEFVSPQNCDLHETLILTEGGFAFAHIDLEVFSR